MTRFNQAGLTACLALLGLLVLPFTYAQQGPGPGQRTRLYNPANETTLKGTVEEVKSVTGRRGWSGTHLILRTETNVTDVQESIEKGKVVNESIKKEDGTVDVHLGPEAFLKDKGFTFAKGDKVEVTGARTSFGNSEAVIAREVKKGSETLTLRDAQGIPKWSRGWRR